jgi:hypothetical protein
MKLSNWHERLCFALFILILAYCLAIFYYFFNKYATNNPYLDDYWAVFDTIFLADEHYQSRRGLLFPNFLHQNLEHIIFYTKTLSYGLYKTLKSNFSLAHLMLIGSLAWFASIGFLMKEFRRTTKANWAWLCVFILLGFSPQLHENFFWGMAATQNLTIILFSILTFYYLIQNTPKSAFIASILGICCFLTSSPWHFIFLIGMFIIVVQKRYKLLILWTTIFVGMIYFHQHQIKYVEDTFDINNWKNIFYFLGNIVHFEGSQVGSFIVGLAIFIFIGYYTFTSNIRRLTQLEMLFLSIAGLTILTAIFGGLKRPDVTLSRYKIYSTLAVLSCIVLIYHRFKQSVDSQRFILPLIILLALIYHVLCVNIYQYDIRKRAEYKWVDAYNYYQNDCSVLHFTALCNNPHLVHKVRASNTNIFKHPNIEYLINHFDKIPIEKNTKISTNKTIQQNKLPTGCIQKITPLKINLPTKLDETYYLMLVGSKKYLYSAFPMRNSQNLLEVEINLQYLEQEDFELNILKENNGNFVRYKLNEVVRGTRN